MKKILLLSAIIPPFLFQSVCAAEIDFSRVIRPILSDKCFLCHGPGAENREADLRLDLRDVAVGTGAIEPGKPAASEILKRILSDDPDFVMPPPSTDKTISADEVTLLRRWISEGAEYSQHWAYVPPKCPDMPNVKNKNRIRNPIDQFVTAKLETQNIEPGQSADRVTLVRRAYLDLLGLPPSPAEVDAFVSDERDNAFPKLVERLLDSPHFGVRWGR